MFLRKATAVSRDEGMVFARYSGRHASYLLAAHDAGGAGVKSNGNRHSESNVPACMTVR